ncbi:sulfatase [Tamlana fucoidanivorans]|uniref:sulfatase n=1 Tax=Allotamlana fucoidanivorans TaxID=2583814 RepID=UPI0013054437|nr:sulfatase [Tamlana fucoidanivorans]
MVHSSKSADKTNYNILFIAVDDLNDWLGFMGKEEMITPNFDELASRGVSFNKAYCAAPLCSPSRASVFTGIYPFNSDLYTNSDSIESRPDLTTIPKYFQQNGYTILGAGKLFHQTTDYAKSHFDYLGPDTCVSGGPFVDGEINSRLQNPVHEVNRGPGKLKAILPLNRMTNDRPYNKYNTFDWGPLDISDDQMQDGKIANWGVEQLKKEYSTPFFLGLGFFRPHQPLFAPKKYHDLYPPKHVKLPEINENDLDDLSDTGRDFSLLAGTSGTHKTVLKHNQWQDAVSSYMASITFIDTQLGKIIKALDNSNYADNTFIVLFSDHGWQLGEKQHWGKWTGWYRSQRVPLIIVPPKQMNLAGFEAGMKSQQVVSLIDIFPTLLDLHTNNSKTNLDGKSLIPYLSKATPIDHNRFVTSTFGLGNSAIIDNDWYYIHYFDGSDELYSLQNDPHQFFNLANKPKYKKIREKIYKTLPEYPEVKHFVRMGRWKAIIFKDKMRKNKLFDIKGQSGIMENNNLIDKRRDVFNDILLKIKKMKSPKKYINILS